MLTVELSAFFFFKQKTAYELRISDWSSDVCSSDLRRKRRRAKRSRLKAQPQRAGCLHPPLSGSGRWTLASILRWSVRPKAGASATAIWTAICAIPPTRQARLKRSEEHTSELQSLMRISYAVFCLKKKKKTNMKP